MEDQNTNQPTTQSIPAPMVEPVPNNTIPQDSLGMPEKNRMMPKLLLFIFALVIFLSLGIVIGVLYTNKTSESTHDLTTPTPEPTIETTAEPVDDSTTSPIPTKVADKVSEVPGRLKVESPTSNQLMEGDSILFKGEMKDFFEGTLNIRLIDEAGDTLFEDVITASGDNYGKFSIFEKNVNFVRILIGAGAEGKWQFIEYSAKDGSETILLSIPVKFVE